MSVYSIKDLEHLSGIKAHTIRIWEQRYQLFSPQRTATNIRFYSDDDLKLILNIASLQHHGYKISKIVGMPRELRQQEVQKLSLANKSFEDQVTALSVAMIDLDEGYFNKIVDSNVKQIGFELTMIKIIYPFLQKIGILWMTNSINPAQEHFISHLVRQKLIVATDELKVPKNGPLFVLFLPEAELHELGLLFANFILRSRGVRTLYFGQIVPLKALEEVYHNVNPEFLFTCITSSPSSKEVQSYINSLSQKFGDSTILITGLQVIGAGLSPSSNVEQISRFEDLISFLENKIGLKQ
jgi:MerR family transcriptional regulator, light-induced transcriptional regulator